MIVSELTAFARAALYDPVPRDHHEPDDVLRRRRIVSVAILLVATALLGWSLSIPPGDPLFYGATAVLAGVYLVGSLFAGRLHLGHAHRRDHTTGRPVLQSVLLGLFLLGLFCAGAVVVAQVPTLRQPVDDLLDHARYGSLGLVAAVTALNGIAEEVFFRGTLYAALPKRSAVAVTTGLYTLVTAVSGIPLLVLAAALLGALVGLQRRVTGGVLGPIITHLVWSLGMLFLLPPLLGALG